MEWRALNTVAGIEEKGLERIGRVAGMNYGRAVQKIFERNPEGKRRM